VQATKYPLATLTSAGRPPQNGHRSNRGDFAFVIAVPLECVIKAPPFMRYDRACTEDVRQRRKKSVCPKVLSEYADEVIGPRRLKKLAVIPKRDLDALTKIFGCDCACVEIIESSRFAKLHFATATTRRNRIYLACDLECFLRDPKLMLHEYYHVLRQWDTRELSVLGYVREWMRNGYWNNRFETEAREFARRHVVEFNRLRRGIGEA